MSRRSEILKCATEVFVIRGVADTSMEHIASAVGVSREAIYYHFRNRGEILLEIIFPPTRELLRGLRQIRKMKLTPVEQIRSAIRHHIGTYGADIMAMSVALRECHYQGDRAKYVSVKEMREEYESLWIAMIDEGKARGDFDASLDSRLAAYAVFGMLCWVSRWYRNSEDFNDEEVADTFFRILTGGLYAATPDRMASGDFS